MNLVNGIQNKLFIFIRKMYVLQGEKVSRDQEINFGEMLLTRPYVFIKFVFKGLPWEWTVRSHSWRKGAVGQGIHRGGVCCHPRPPQKTNQRLRVVVYFFHYIRPVI